MAEKKKKYTVTIKHVKRTNLISTFYYVLEKWRDIYDDKKRTITTEMTQPEIFKLMMTISDEFGVLGNKACPVIFDNLGDNNITLTIYDDYVE